jgi:hypothetical protein
MVVRSRPPIFPTRRQTGCERSAGRFGKGREESVASTDIRACAIAPQNGVADLHRVALGAANWSRSGEVTGSSQTKNEQA